MSRWFLIVAALVCLSPAMAEAACDDTCTAGSACTGSSVTDGIFAITLDTTHTCGRFVDGTFWIVVNGDGDVDVTGVTAPNGGGAHLNPSVVNNQGFVPGGVLYNAGSNFASGPITASSTTKGSLIVASRATVEADCNQGSLCTDSEGIFTVLDAVPTDNGSTIFRPGLAGNVKRLFSTTLVETSKLPNIPSIASDPSQVGFSTITARWRIPGWDMCLLGENCRKLLPFGGGNGPGWGASYGGEMAAKYLQDMLSVMGNESLGVASDPTSRIRAVYALMQRGIDIYSMYHDIHHRWPAGAGQKTSRKPPLLFFAALYNDAAIRAEVTAIRSQKAVDGFHHFDEDGHFHRTPSGVVVVGDDGTPGIYDQTATPCTEDRYWDRITQRHCDGGNPKRDCADPYLQIDGDILPGQGYVGCCYGGNAVALVLGMYLMPSMNVLNNSNDILDFADRWSANPNWPNDGNAHTIPDTCAKWSCTPGTKGVTWGPVPGNESPKQCIQHGGNPNTQGRFPSFHGTGNMDNTPVLAQNLWDTLRSCAVDCSCTGQSGLCGSGGSGLTLAFGVAPSTREINASSPVVTATATPAGGTSPYTVTFDLDADGAYDDATDASSPYTAIVPAFSTLGNKTIGAHVVDNVAATQNAQATLTITPDCGDGVIQAPELCEPTNVGASCAQAGYAGAGAPGCNVSCSAYTQGTCTAAVCGDGLCEPLTECSDSGCVVTSCFADCANWTDRIAANTVDDGWVFVQNLQPVIINKINMSGVVNHSEIALDTEPITTAISGFSYLDCDYPAGDNCIPLSSTPPVGSAGIQNSSRYAPFGDDGPSVADLFPPVPPLATGTRVWKIQACTADWTTTSACGAGTKSVVRTFNVQVQRPSQIVTPNAPTPAPVEVASPIVPFDPTAPAACWARYARWQTSPPVEGALTYRWLIDGTALSADTTTPSVAIRCPPATDSLGPISVQAIGLESESAVSSASSPNSCGAPEWDVASCGAPLGKPKKPKLRGNP